PSSGRSKTQTEARAPHVCVRHLTHHRKYARSEHTTSTDGAAPMSRRPGRSPCCLSARRHDAPLNTVDAGHTAGCRSATDWRAEIVLPTAQVWCPRSFRNCRGRSVFSWLRTGDPLTARELIERTRDLCGAHLCSVRAAKPAYVPETV